MQVRDEPRVLILGAGINGSALARELAANGVGVWIVDRNDIAFGATSRSSRLIHGGLRYLEFGDFDLVRESLAERERLLQFAPQFVTPLRLYIPVAGWSGGLLRGAFRFFGGTRSRLLHWLCSPLPGSKPRGLWVVRAGLWFYDRFTSNPNIPRQSVHPVTATNVPQVDTAKYRALVAYTDAQMQFPERFTIALLEDARQAAAEHGSAFRVWTHFQVTFQGNVAELRRMRNDSLAERIQPEVVVNASGAWGDLTLGACGVPAERLFGGTKGSHLVTYSSRLRSALGNDGIYAEAADGRLVFILPFGSAVLIGTTDERFEDHPERAVAEPHEVDYLIRMVNHVVPSARLTREDVHLHYSGVRPLPHVSGGTPAAITRDHKVVHHRHGNQAFFTLVGGKLTTCRALAEETANHIFEELGVQRTADTHSRIVPGGEHYPRDEAAQSAEIDRLGRQFQMPMSAVRVIWSLCGTRCEQILSELEGDLAVMISDTEVSVAFARWVIRHEWVVTLSDLIERRLMLLYEPRLSVRSLQELASCLVETNRLTLYEVDTAVTETINRLERVYGKRVCGQSAPLEASSGQHR